MRRSLAVVVFLLCGVLFPGLGLAQGVSPKVSPDLVSLYQEHRMPPPSQPAAPAAPEPLATSTATLPLAQDWVTIDAAASGDPDALLADLAALGLVSGGSHGRMVSGLLPVSAISALENLGSLQFVRPAYFTTRAGLVTSQGDQAQRSDLARTTFGFSGTGVTVGVLSDSFNCVLTGATTAATDVANGDLSPVNVVQESPSCTGQIDEGRAMLQIVHDVAPGAGLAFATANGGQANFANNITALRTLAGADVIVDDVIYFAEPMFQDGIIAQAVDAAVAAGVPYFSSAGNEARQAYDSPFRAGGFFAAGSFGSASFLGGTAHDFDAGGGTDVFQSLTFPGTGTYHMVLQWDSPFFSVSGAPGTRNDLNIYFLNSTNTAVLVAVNTDNTAGGAGGDAVEVVTLTVTGTPTVNLMIVNRTGANPGRLKYVFDRPVTLNEYATNSGTIYGHANAAGAEAVGAAYYVNTPAFGVNPPVLESYSSAGTTPILFTTTGTPTFDARASKPEIVAPDGANTTFFGSDTTADADTFPNFFGTSAAAPHAAAVAALILQSRPGLSPAEVYAALETTALDMGTPGFDNDSGFGLIRADAALASLPVPTVALSLSGSPMAEAGGTATVTATLSRLTGLAVTVTLAFSGTASFPADYTRSGSVITIPAGSLTGTITLTAAQDAIYEGDEAIVVAIAGATNATAAGGSVTATITDDDPAPPGAATLVAPSGSIATTTPTYSWNAVTGATRYLLWVDDSSGGRIRTTYTEAQAGCVGGTGTCAITPAVVLTPGTGLWWIVAGNASGNGPWSSAMAFNVAGAPPPGAATLVAPSASIATTTPTYTWNAVTGATQYLLWVDDASGGRIRTTYTAAQAGCAGGTGTCAITPAVVLRPGAGQWWIVAGNASGNGPWSSAMAFTVAGTPPPGAATLVTPSGSVATTTPTYTWNAATGATQYLLWVDDSSGGRIRTTYTAAQTGCAGGTGTCAITPAVVLTPGAGHCWMVAGNASGNGPWSSAMAFTVAGTPPPGAATLVTPSGSIATATPTYTWNAVTGATQYLLWVDDSSGGRIRTTYTAAQTGCASGTGTCSITPAVVLTPGAGQWWIVAGNASGNGPWSQSLSVTVP